MKINRKGQKKILVTGFKPFAGRKANVTEDIVKSLDGLKIKEIEICKVIIPVKWGAPRRKIRKAIKKIQNERQKLVAILGLGECSGTKIKVEERARNQHMKSKDETVRIGGDTNTSPGGSVVYNSPLYETIMKALENTNFKSSRDAGSFLCEESFYVSMDLTSPKEMKAGNAGFVHIPRYPNATKDKSDQQNARHFKIMRKAVKRILRALEERFQEDP